MNVRPYRLPEKYKMEVNKQLNDLTIDDSFPLPNITDILDQLENAKYFTILDLASSYHQIPLTEKDKNKIAFSTPYGHYEFNRMPFGLKNAPATFQPKPLTKLTKKTEKFEWETEQQNAFEILKEKLMTAPVLRFPDFNQEFTVITDASDYAIGAVLSQGKVGDNRPIVYASRVLSRAEQNYNTTEKELLAIVWAVKHFRLYVYGTKFKIITDHKPLIWLFNVNDPGLILIRWRLKLEEYDYEIIHKAGRANANADALSRNEIRDTNEKQKLYEYHDAPTGGHQEIE
ncbi:hypothetical protein ACFW04_013697 [Cataglyphis niger]